MTNSLNQGQQEAADGFFQFLFSDQTEYAISGPGGVGKTHLMSNLIDRTIPQYQQTCQMMGLDAQFDEVFMTATTNKAAEVLSQATQRPTSTIQSLMNLKVKKDWSTGGSKLIKKESWKVHEKKIIFIDECSMIDSQLLSHIHEGTLNCKIVYVGDHCQLAPVKETLSPIYNREIPFFELKEQMRTNNPHLQAINNQLRETVETGVFKPIQIVPGAIDFLDDEGLARELQSFKEQSHDKRVLAYTNARVNAYNDFIRQDVRGLPPEFTEGELLVNNSAIQLRKSMIRVEEELTIGKTSLKTEMVFLEPGVELEVRRMDLISRAGGVFYDVPVPVNRYHFDELVRHYKREKKWSIYFMLTETYPDLRPFDAATVHKAQGSTYDTVYIDLGDISTATRPDMAARMLYVAFSRARSRVFLYGNLASKFGGLII